MKREKIKNILIGVFTFVLIIYISVGFTLFAMLNISKNYINKNKMENIIDNIDISNLLKNNSEIIKIKNELLDIGLPNDSVEAFFNSSDVKNFENEVVSNVIYDILNKGIIEYKIDDYKINKLLYDNIAELKIDDKINHKYQEMSQKIENKLPNLVDISNNMLDKISNKIQNSESFKKYKNYINQSFKIFDIIYNPLVSILIIIVILSFIGLLIYIREPYKSLKWIGISFIIPGIILKIFNKILYKILQDNNFNELINVISTQFNTYFIIYFIFGFLFILINIIIYFLRKKKTLSN